MAVDRRTMLRVGALLLGVAALVVVVAVALVGGEPDASDTTPTARKAHRAAVLTVVAQPNITFDRKEYVVPAGRLEVHLTGAPGISLMFDDRRFRSCQLALGQTAAGRETAREPAR
jgi:hypothetical protein